MTDFNTIFEKLRLQAEHNTKDTGTDKRKPSWAPAMVLGDKIVAALADLKHPPLDRNVARLCAKFNRDKLVEGFALHLGTERSGELVLLASRNTIAWIATAFANWHGAYPPTWSWGFRDDLEVVKSDVDYFRKTGDDRLTKAEAELVRLERMDAEIRTERAVNEQQREAFKQLILERVAEFARDPLEQMADSARITGNCCICGRLLTDPRVLRVALARNATATPDVRPETAQGEAAS